MKTSRRNFIRSASAVGALAALPGSVIAQGTAPKPLDILILGGTGFIGPHEINYARSRGHNITMFNRGKTAPGMFPDVETLIGDRDDQLDSLRGRDWDAVIDNSGFFPRHARLTAELLHGHVDQYMFVSSISAYSESLTVQDDEFSAAYGVMDDPTDESEHIYGPTYGPRKALCEQEVTKVFADKAINIRPGIITGVGDPTERLRHWLRRMQAGNEILVPGVEDLPVQYIDAADLCGWMVRMLVTAAVALTTRLVLKSRIARDHSLNTFAMRPGRRQHSPGSTGSGFENKRQKRRITDRGTEKDRFLSCRSTMTGRSRPVLRSGRLPTRRRTWSRDSVRIPLLYLGEVDSTRKQKLHY